MNTPETVTSKEQTLINLINGTKKPRNKKERLILKDIKAIEKKGGIADIPSNGV